MKVRTKIVYNNNIYFGKVINVTRNEFNIDIATLSATINDLTQLHIKTDKNEIVFFNKKQLSEAIIIYEIIDEKES